jgi:hypothetical protein
MLKFVNRSIFKGLHLACALHHNRYRYGVTKAVLMLKIQRVTDGQRVVFTLSGCIERDQVAELQRLFALEAEGISLVLDLHEVGLVDREAVRFLAQCEAAGTTLTHCPAYIREWIVREKDQL